MCWFLVVTPSVVAPLLELPLCLAVLDRNWGFFCWSLWLLPRQLPLGEVRVLQGPEMNNCLLHILYVLICYGIPWVGWLVVLSGCVDMSRIPRDCFRSFFWKRKKWLLSHLSYILSCVFEASASLTRKENNAKKSLVLKRCRRQRISSVYYFRTDTPAPRSVDQWVTTTIKRKWKGLFFQPAFFDFFLFPASPELIAFRSFHCRNALCRRSFQ